MKKLQKTSLLLSITVVLVVLLTYLAQEVESNCYNSCSNAGTCINSVCHCIKYRGGIDCSIFVLPLGVGTGDQTSWVGTVDSNFKTFEAHVIVGQTYNVSVQPVGSGTFGCMLYVNYNNIPSLFNYYTRVRPDASDVIHYISRPNYNETLYLSVTSPNVPASCHFNISIALVGANNNPYQAQMVTLNHYYPTHLPSSNTASVLYLLSTSYSTQPYSMNMTSNCSNVIRFNYGSPPTPSQYYHVYYNWYASSHYSFSNSYPNASLYFTVGRVYSSDRFCLLNFTISQPSQPVCVSDCSNHGTCYYSTCYCHTGYYGTYCQTKSASLQTGEIVTGYIETGLYNYYNYHSSTVNPLYIYLNTTTANSTSIINTNNTESCSMYISKHSYPSTSYYDYSYVNIQKVYGERIMIEIPQGGIQTWYMAVYGTHKCHYSMTVQSTSVCGELCVPPFGFCPSNSTGECKCLANYTGPDCRSVVLNLNGNGTTIRGEVQSGKWNYYRYQVIRNGIFGIVVTLVEKGSTGGVGLYMNEQSYTTLQGSTKSDAGAKALHQITMMNVLPVGEYYYIGVYGSSLQIGQTSYELNVFVNPF